KRDLSAAKRKVIYWLILTVVANAIFDVCIDLPYRDWNFIVFATTGLAAFFAFAWVSLDAKEHGLNLKAWGAPIVLLTKFTLPFYFVISRGWKGGLIANLWTLTLLLFLLGAYVVAVELTVLAFALFQ
ncbi:MAG: hypothetical protein P1V97_35240, partial [Planctomycetota bacterium]|nr:hypothetical protein [Planctomycetota bacterium]